MSIYRLQNLRVYPLPFVAKLYRAFFETEAMDERRDLRHKAAVDPAKSDRELFLALPLGDVWDDANMARTYFYARSNKRLKIPPAWEEAFDQFDHELRTKASKLIE